MKLKLLFAVLLFVSLSLAFHTARVAEEVVVTQYAGLIFNDVSLSASFSGVAGAGEVQTIEISSVLPDAFRFGAYNTSQVFLVLKNRSSNTGVLPGQVFYVNATGQYVNASASWSWGGPATARDLTVELPPFYYSPSESVQIKALFDINTPAGTAPNFGRVRLVSLGIPELNATGFRVGNWVIFYRFSSASSTDGAFSGSPTSSQRNKVFYESLVLWPSVTKISSPLPFYSHRGSRMLLGGFRADQVEIQYATVPPYHYPH